MRRLRSGYADYLRMMFEQTGNPADLTKAIELARSVVASANPRDPDYARHLTHLANALQTRFMVNSDAADLDDILALRRRAANAPSARAADRTSLLANLATTLMLRFEYAAQPADLDEAIGLAELLPGPLPGDPSGAGLTANLVIGLRFRAKLTGTTADLDRAVTMARSVLDTAPEHAPHRSRLELAFGAALINRFERTGAGEDLEDGIAALSSAAASDQVNALEHASCLSTLGAALVLRFLRVGEIGDLADAVEFLREARQITPPDYPDRRSILTNLSFALRLATDATDEPLQLISEGLQSVEEALELTPGGHGGRSTMLASRASLSGTKFQFTHDRTDIDRAIAEEHDDDFSHAGLRVLRFEAFHEPADLDRAIASYDTASRTGTTSLSLRLTAARREAELIADYRSLADAAGPYRRATLFLPLLAWPGINYTDRESMLVTLGLQLGCDAGAAGLAAGRTSAAVEILETGRAVTWTQLLNMRTDLSKLAGVSPELAQALLETRRSLEELAASPRRQAPTPPSEADRAQSLNERAIDLAAAGHQEEAIRTFAEAVRILRRLAAADPDYFDHYLAMTLSNLAGCLSDDRALPLRTEVAAVYRRLAAADPAGYNTQLAGALSHLISTLRAW